MDIHQHVYYYTVQWFMTYITLCIKISIFQFSQITDNINDKNELIGNKTVLYV